MAKTDGSPKSAPNRLFFGDNLDVLRREIEAQSVDLVYLDPPFNSSAEFNVLFETPDAEKASAQAEAFRDTWTWGEESEIAYDEVMTRIGGRTAQILKALRSALRESDMMAYLAMMAVRLVELNRVLKPNGAIYLHCDPTASHYLKVLLDGIFGPGRFLSEIVWKRTSAHSAAQRWADIHDSILFFSKGDDYTWNQQFTPYDESYKARFKRIDDQGRAWTDDNLTAPGVRHGYSGASWRGFNPTDKGNHWKVSRTAVIELIGEERAKKLSTIEKLDVLDKHGLIYWPGSGGFPRFKRVLGRGMPLQDIISDIPPLNSQAIERIGYPTQKPVALLDRILQASSDRGMTILDPFCGCGTTIEAAHKLGRRWIGIDVAYHAVRVIEGRMQREFKGTAKFDVFGIPGSFKDAVELAERDKYQFQWWANYLFNPHAVREIKKGADRGIDGELYFPMGPGHRSYARLLISAKGGKNLNPAMIREFSGVIKDEGALMGLFVCLHRPTDEMERAALAAGFVDTAQGRKRRLQIVSIEGWFENERPDLPHAPQLDSALFSRRKKRAPISTRRPHPDAPELPLTFSEDIVRHLNPAMVVRSSSAGSK